MFPSRRITTSGGDVFRDEYSLEFDGTDDYVDTGTGIDLGSTTDFTITFWAKTDDWTSQLVMGKFDDGSNRWYISATGSDYLNFFCIAEVGEASAANGIDYTGTTALTNGEWTHIAIVADRDASTKGYINGVLDDTDTGADPDLDIDISSAFIIGKVSTNFFSGNISEVSIWNTALSSNQVKQLYNGREPFDARNVAKSSLVSYWRMGDGVLDQRVKYGLLADQVTATIGSELISNGTFTDNITGWEDNSTGSASISHNASGYLNLLGVDTSNRAKADESFSTTSGETYLLSVDHISGATGWIIRIGTSKGATTHISDNTGASNNIFCFKATGSTTWVRLEAYAGTAVVDNVSVKVLGGNAGLMVNMTADDFVGDTP